MRGIDFSTPYVESPDWSTDHDNRRGQVTTYERVRRDWAATKGAQQRQKMNNQPSTPLDRAKTVHHSHWTDYALRQFDDEYWRAATNDANNGQDAARAATTTRPDPRLKTQQPPKPLPPPEPPTPQPRRPRPGTATGNHARQRAANYHQSDPSDSASPAKICNGVTKPSKEQPPQPLPRPEPPPPEPRRPRLGTSTANCAW